MIRRLALLAGLLPGLAWAQAAPEARTGFQLDLGAGPLLYPSYPGASRSRVLPFPVISGGYGEWVDFDLLDGVRVNALRGWGFSAGPAALLRFGRHTSDGRRQLQGLRSFSDTIEAGGFVAYENGPFYADATLTQDVGHAHRGAALQLRAMLSMPIGRFGIEAGPMVRFMDAGFARSFYGISASHAAASGRLAYRPTGGVERVGGVVSAEYRFDDRFSLRGFVEVARLEEQAARSPIVRSGSATQSYAGAFLVWRAW